MVMVHGGFEYVLFGVGHLEHVHTNYAQVRIDAFGNFEL
jgi:hypothetical protein